MAAYLAAFVIAGINPFGGMFVALPLAIFKLGWPPWLATLAVIPLAYVQVLAIDLSWERLLRFPKWVSFVEKRRSQKLAALLERRDAALWLAFLSPWLGPWLVAATSRFAGGQKHRFAPSLLFGLSYVAVATAVLCIYAPDWLPK